MNPVKEVLVIKNIGRERHIVVHYEASVDVLQVQGKEHRVLLSV